MVTIGAKVIERDVFYSDQVRISGNANDSTGASRCTMGHGSGERTGVQPDASSQSSLQVG